MFKKFLVWIVMVIFSGSLLMKPVYIYAYNKGFEQQVVNDFETMSSYQSFNMTTLQAIKNVVNYFLGLLAFVVLVKGLRDMDFGFIMKYTFIIGIVWFVASFIFAIFEYSLEK
jgi:hypothetical protein